MVFWASWGPQVGAMLVSGGLGLVSRVVRGLWGPLINTEKSSKTISITVIMTLYYCSSALYQNLSKGCWWLCALVVLQYSAIHHSKHCENAINNGRQCWVVTAEVDLGQAGQSSRAGAGKADTGRLWTRGAPSLPLTDHRLESGTVGRSWKTQCTQILGETKSCLI